MTSKNYAEVISEALKDYSNAVTAAHKTYDAAVNLALKVYNETITDINKKKEGKKMTSRQEELLKDLKIYTDNNNHTEWVVVLAGALGDTSTLRAAQAVRTLHDYLGNMPPSLSELREGIIIPRLLAMSEERWDKEFAKAIEQTR